MVTSSFHSSAVRRSTATQRTHTIVTRSTSAITRSAERRRVPRGPMRVKGSAAVGFAPGSCLSTTRNPSRRTGPELLHIVEERVKPKRYDANRKAHRERWWRYAETRPGLNAAVSGLDRVLVISQVTTHLAFAFVSTRKVFSHRLYVFADDRDAFFGSLQSRVHETWCRALGSSLGDGPMYSAEDCFETFPFPDHWESRPDLDAASNAYYEHRAALMVANNEGLTRTYNRFHDPYERSPGIVRLRELHSAMDRAVLAAYGWDDIPTDCDFFPLHEDAGPLIPPADPRVSQVPLPLARRNPERSPNPPPRPQHPPRHPRTPSYQGTIRSTPIQKVRSTTHVDYV